MNESELAAQRLAQSSLSGFALTYHKNYWCYNYIEWNWL